MLAKEKKW